MDCAKAGEYMMRFMDGILTKEEAERLGNHLGECSSCKEDFIIYDGIMSDFSTIEIINAPDNFEELVMQKVMALPQIGKKMSDTVDNIICVVWGTFSVLFGIGFIATINRANIIAYFHSRPELSGYTEILNSVSGYVTKYSNNLIGLFNSTAATALEYLSSSRYVLLIIFAVLAVIQYVLFRRDKVGA